MFRRFIPCWKVKFNSVFGASTTTCVELVEWPNVNFAGEKRKVEKENDIKGESGEQIVFFGASSENKCPKPKIERNGSNLVKREK